MALMNQAHTVNGSRGSVIPWARRSMVVTLKLSALHRDAAQKIGNADDPERDIGVREIKNAPVRPTNEATVAQKASRFSVGKAISRAPICAAGSSFRSQPGRRGEHQKNHQRAMECRKGRVTIRRVAEAGEQREMRSGHTRWMRMSSDMAMPRNTLNSAQPKIAEPMVLWLVLKT